MAKVKDPDVKAFIEKCTANVPERLSAIQLLRDPFLSDSDLEAIGSSLHVNVHSSGKVFGQKQKLQSLLFCSFKFMLK